MDIQEFFRKHPGRGELTGIAKFAAAAPELPRSALGRRRDVFQAYRALAEAHREGNPVQAFTVRLVNGRLATADGGQGASALGAEGEVFPMIFSQWELAQGLLREAPSRRLEGPTAVMTEITAGRNYYHWLLTAVPKLLILMYRYGRLKFEHVVVNDAEAPFVRETLAFLGVPAEAVVTATGSPVLEIAEGYYATAASELIYPHGLIAEMFRAVFPRAFYRGKRIFISRRGTRTIENEAEVVEALRPLGFEAVQLESLNFAEQVRLFSQAEAVIGPHGAGMSNLVFCPTRTKVLEIFSPRQVAATYWFLASACGHEYHYMLGMGEDKPFQSDDWRSAERPEIRVNAEDLRKAVGEMGLG